MLDLKAFDRDGFALIPGVLDPADTARLVALLNERVQPGSARGGVRDVMDALPEVKVVSSYKPVRRLVEAILGLSAISVRSTLFDKTDSANWKVPWHQDLTIAVQERRDVDHYGPWSVKSGIIHVQPPTRVLECMVTVRIHLDPCPASNGALRVLPGSHRLGRLDQNLAMKGLSESDAVVCAAEPGEALVMRPLLLHASSASEMPAHRRVLHFDFAACALDGGLVWRLAA